MIGFSTVQRLYLVSAMTMCHDTNAFRIPSPSVSNHQRFHIRSHDTILPKISIGTSHGGRSAKLIMLSSSENSDLEATVEDESHKQKKKLTREFFNIAVPAFFQLAAEPLAGLVDTAYLGRLGPEVLGGAGVAISAQYAMSKLYNDPLLRTSISLVASEDGKAAGKQDDHESKSQALSIAVSSALLLAFTVGMIQLVLYFGFASSILRGMGVTQSSSMHYSAFCKSWLIDLLEVIYLYSYLMFIGA